MEKIIEIEVYKIDRHIINVKSKGKGDLKDILDSLAYIVINHIEEININLNEFYFYCKEIEKKKKTKNVRMV